MKTLCFSLMLAVLAAAPFEATYAASADATTATLTAADHDAFGGGYKFKRKKRKKNRSAFQRRRKGGFLGFGR